MDNPWDEILQIFQSLAVICDTVSALYMTPPSQPIIDSLGNLDQEEMIGLGDRDLADGMQMIATFCRQGDAQKRLLDMVADHSRLFIGPMHVYAPPWSSIYLDNGMLNGPATLETMKMYRTFGVQVPNPGQEPEDHIAYEMSFVAELSRRTQASIQSGNFHQTAEVICALNEFLTNHLSKWLGAFTGRVSEHALTDFYRGLAKLTLGVFNLACESVRQASTELTQTV